MSETPTSLDDLIRYFRVRPVDAVDVDAEWDAFVADHLTPDGRAQLRRQLDLPHGARLLPDCYHALDDSWKAHFADWLEQINWDGCIRVEDPHAAPAWTLLWPVDPNVAHENGWWLHFTDHPAAIAREGFRYGVQDPDGLALTRLNDVFGNTTRIPATGPGYQFAYATDGSVDLDRRAGAYGRHAVLAHAPALRVHHAGDREEQAILHGPSIPNAAIRPLFRADDGWQDDRGTHADTLADLVARLTAAAPPS